MEPDKSIASGISIPNWMKQKIAGRYDLDDSAFSPPTQDENFFYIRYPKTTIRPPSQTNYHKIEKYLEAQQQAEGMSSSTAISTAALATDSSAFASSSSNQQSLTSQLSTPMNIEFEPDQPQPNLTHRRGSKSLPTSPLSSPKNSRKNNLSALQNRYFTAAFSKPQEQVGPAGWLVSSLLGPREASVEPLPPISESPAIAADSALVSAEAATPTSQLAIPAEQGLRKVKSAVVLRDDEAEQDKSKVTPLMREAKKIQAFRPKPSELREMNFWSPTSM